MKRGIIGIGLVLGVLVVVGLVLRARARQDRNPEDLQTVQVERGMVQLSVSADGVLQPLTTVAVKSYAGGSIDLLDVEVGDEVEEGGLIAKIDPTDSRTAYDQAVADLTAARARLTQAREQAARQPALTRAGIAQAEASHRSALKDLERLEQATQPQTRVQARATLDKAKANLAIAER